jgi:putative endonuclease
MNNKSLGDAGEAVVASWLKENGFKILAQNFACKCGEIDLIAQKEEVVAFVEVKTRINEYFPTSTVVNRTKQHKMIKTAERFALKFKLFEHVLRFDVATVTFDENNKPQVTYIPNAFSL